MSEACVKCGELGDPIEAIVDGDLVAVGSLCAKCMEIAHRGADFLREKFDALRATGMSRKRANAVMIRWWVPVAQERCDQEREALR